MIKIPTLQVILTKLYFSDTFFIVLKAFLSVWTKSVVFKVNNIQISCKRITLSVRALVKQYPASELRYGSFTCEH